jgi:hypothetical protein
VIEIAGYEANIHQVEINKLLLVEIARSNVLEDVGEQSGHILAKRHGHDGLLDGLLALVGILRDKAGAQLKRLSLARDGEGASNAIYRHGGGILRWWRSRW